MIYLYIILAVISYIVIGGFVIGICGEDAEPESIFLITFWPLFLVHAAIISIAYLPSKLGKKLVFVINRFKRRKK